MSDPGTYCQICERSFASKASLRRQARRKHDASYLEKIREQHTTCPHCGDQFRNPHSLGGHMVMCSDNPNVERTRDRISEAHQGTTHPEAVKEQIQESMRRAVQENPASYATDNVCGRVERLEVKTLNGTTTMLHGEWEREVAQFLNRNQIRWTNDVPGFPYSWEGATHQYFPDFYLPNRDLYNEVKGYEREHDRAKWSAFPETLLLIRRGEIKQIRNGTYELGP